MRKQNAQFVTAFTSEAERKIKNTDSFGFVELDKYACYVIADGIDDNVDSISAKLAVDTIISRFTEAPAMNKRTIKKCLNAANKALLNAASKMKLKASIVMVVTDYSKLRYGQAGNTRLHLYRDGFLREATKDQSLSMDLIAAEQLSPAKLALHEQRNNLYCYLGQESDFNPIISKKIKVQNTDAIALYTRGIWENVDDGELLDAFKDATEEPTPLVDNVEELMLSKQPKNLEKYTFAAIFINKVYIDQGIKRKIKKIIIIVLPILTILITISMILGFRYMNRQKNKAFMETHFLDTIAYIHDDNYIRAKETADKARDYAEKAKEKKMQLEISEYLKLVESIIDGDDKLSREKYVEANRQYQNAKDRARYADNIGMDYINSRLNLSGTYITIYDLISLGDSLLMNLQYDKAEARYQEAKRLADSIYFDKGRENAKQALENLYMQQKELKAAADEVIKAQITAQMIAQELLNQGDLSFHNGNYDEARLYYLSSIEKYTTLQESIQVEAIQKKIDSIDQLIKDQSTKFIQAEAYVDLADTKYEEKSLLQAKKYYLFAKDIFASLKEDVRVLEVNRKIEMIDLDIQIEQQEKSIEEIKVEEVP